MNALKKLYLLRALTFAINPNDDFKDYNGSENIKRANGATLKRLQIENLHGRSKRPKRYF
jgi:hypothetical protein